MRKADCLQWARSLIDGKYRKLTGTMSNASYADRRPSACCCLGVLNETFKPRGFSKDRLAESAVIAANKNIISYSDPEIFGIAASSLNDGGCVESLGIPENGLTHEQIGILLLLAIESGEYKNI